MREGTMSHRGKNFSKYFLLNMGLEYVEISINVRLDERIKINVENEQCMSLVLNWVWNTATIT